MTRVLDASGEHRADAVAAAADALRAGGAVVLPTDTVYGVAADAFNPAGTARVFAAKGRSRELPLPVFVHSPKQLPGLAAHVGDEAERLMAAFWPGALTIVLAAQVGLRWDLGESDGTVAVRMPLDDVALAVVRAVGPLAATSANRSGTPPATTAQQAAEALGDDVEVVLDDGPRTTSIPSTIVDLTRAVPYVIRAGAIDEGLVFAVANGAIEPLEAAARLAGEHERERGDTDGDGSPL